MKSLGLAVILSLAATATSAQSLIVVRGDGVAVRFTVEVAATESARSRGLMGRRALPPRHGMWFDFGVEAPVAMWMKDTFVSLDMLFFDARQRLVHARPGTEPLSEVRIRAPRPVRYVLEINAGEMTGYGLAPGDRAIVLPCPGE